MVNITMLVRNRPLLTQQALSSIIATAGCNVTILDDRSEDETVRVLRKYQGGVALARNEAVSGTGELRNRVISTSAAYFGRGDYLYLSDNDVYFMVGWLEVLVRCYEFAEKEGFRVLGAYNHPFHQPISRRYMPDGYAIEEVQALALQSMLMRWETWDKYGPFKETPDGLVCQGEDCVFGDKIRADGGRLGVVSPALLVNCGITNTRGEHIPGWEMVQKQAPPGVVVE